MQVLRIDALDINYRRINRLKEILGDTRVEKINPNINDIPTRLAGRNHCSELAVVQQDHLE